MRASRVMIGAVAGLLFVTACGGDDDGSVDAPDTTTRVETTVSGEPATGDETTGSDDAGGDTWTGSTELGMPLSAELWVDPADDATLTAFEEYRELIGAPEVAYIRVVADNSAGTADDTGRFFTFTDAEGDMFADGVATADFLCSSLAIDWVPSAGATPEVIEAYNALYDGECADARYSVNVPAGETVTYYLAIDEQPTFERVFAGAGNELTN